MVKPALPFPAKPSAATADTRHPLVANALTRNMEGEQRSNCAGPYTLLVLSEV
jgi:hypothetical protein